MNRIATRLGLAALIVLGATIYAEAAGAPQIAVRSNAVDVRGGSIRLDNVRIQNPTGFANDFSYPGLVSVAFTNTNSVAATQIVFGLKNESGILTLIKDVGTYPQGQTVRHTFTGVAILDSNQLEVEEATFADGSVWTNTGATALPIRRQSY